MILLDTNILLRFTDVINPDCGAARNAMRTLRKRGEILALVPQNLYEYWSVASRPTGAFPSANGLGLSANRADLWIGYWLRNYPMLPDAADLHERWRTLVRTFNVIGKKAHDARLVAAMQTHLIPELLTFNGSDFKRFHFIKVIDPRTV